MAAAPQVSPKEIEKRIIQLALGDELASMKLFDIQSYGGILEDEKDTRKRTQILEDAAKKRAQFITNSIFLTGRRAELIKKIETELGITENRATTVFKELSDSKRIAYLFELTAEITLENITKKESISEIERLQLFLRFLEGFILYYPYPSYYSPEMVSNISFGSSGEKNIRQIGKEFSEIYAKFNLFKKQIESFLYAQEQNIEEIFIKYEAEIKKISKDQKDEIEKLLRAQQAEIEVFQAAQKKERDAFLIEKLREFSSYIGEIKYYSLIGTPEGRALIGQLDVMKEALRQIGERLALLEEKEEESGILSTERKKEEQKVDPLSTDETEQLLATLKTYLMKARNISEEEAEAQAQTFLKEAKQESTDLPAAPPLPLSNQMAVSQTGLKPAFIASLRAVVLRSIGDPSKDAEKQFDELVASTGQIDQQAVLESKSRLTRTQSLKIPFAIAYNQITSMDKNLDEQVTLHVLSVLPEGEKLDQLENGYILIGHENPARARLYYLHKDKKDKLVECRGDRAPLCKHVSELQETCLNLDRKQHKELIINNGGGHNYKLAQDAAPAFAVSLQAAPVLASQSSMTLLSGPRQKPFNFEDYNIVLLKNGEDFPEGAALEPKTLYFKWDKPNLTVKHKVENGNADKIRQYGRPISDPDRIALISSAFEAAEKEELTPKASQSLRDFAERPLPVRSSMQQNVKGIQPSDAGKKEEKANEEEKKESGSPENSGNTILSGSPKATFHSPQRTITPDPVKADSQDQSVTFGMNDSPKK